MVSSKWKTPENGRRTRYYEISAAGRKRLQEHESQWLWRSAGVARALAVA